MTTDKKIFGLRFESNAELTPSPDELRAFLESPKKPGRTELHGDELRPYRRLLDELSEFKRRRQLGSPSDVLRDHRDQMLYNALEHCQFTSPALRQAVEQFKYHLHALAAIDAGKPAAFIASAEKEMRTLNPRIKADAAKLARLSAMVADRKRQIETLAGRRPALSGELAVIALYLRDSLARMAHLCETSIAVLVELQISKKPEKELIRELTEDFKTQHAPWRRDARAEPAGAAAREVAALSKEMSDLCREDLFALMAVYESIHDYALKFSREIHEAISELKEKNRSFNQDLELFAGLEKILARLMSEFRFEVKTTVPADGTAYRDMLLKCRNVLLARLFERLKKERRSGRERRTGQDRRKAQDPNYRGAERRAGKDRRAGKGRRTRGPLF